MSRRASILLVAVLATLLAPSALAKARFQDRVWTRPDAVRYPIRRVAMLPIAMPTYMDARRIEELTLLHFIQDGHDWVPAEISRSSLIALSPSHPDSAVDAIYNQVWKSGTPDPRRVPYLSRLLGSQALLAISVQRWEREIEMDARITTAHIELTATLVDSTGRALWRITGGERQVAKHGFPQRQAASGISGGTGSTVRMYGGSASTSGAVSAPVVTIARVPEGGTAPALRLLPAADVAPDFMTAMDRLLTRWVLSYPYASADSNRAR